MKKNWENEKKWNERRKRSGGTKLHHLSLRNSTTVYVSCRDNTIVVGIISLQELAQKAKVVNFPCEKESKNDIKRGWGTWD